MLKPWVVLRPQDAAAWELMTRAYFGLEDWRLAREAAEKVLQLAPDSAAAHTNLALVLRRLGRLGEAERLLLQALDLDPAHDRARTELARIEQLRQARQGQTAEGGEASEPAAEPERAPCACCGKPVEHPIAEANGGVCDECLIASPPPDEGLPVEQSHGWRWGWTVVAVAAVLVLALGTGYLLAHRHAARDGAPPIVFHRRPAPVPAVTPAPAGEPKPAAHTPETTATAENVAPVAASGPADAALRDEALKAAQTINEAVGAGVYLAKYPAYVTAAEEKLSALTADQKQHPFWQELAAAVDEYKTAGQVWALTSAGVTSVGVQSPQGQWALKRYPQVRNTAVADPAPAKGGLTYSLPVTSIVQAAWVSAASHLAKAVALREST